MKKTIILFLFFLVIIEILSGQPVDESQIPAAEIEYELPEIIIGEFILISSGREYNITIFPNNKFIYTAYDFNFYIYWCCGHIVNINNKWYISPLPRGMFNTEFEYSYEDLKLKEILLTDTGFSFLGMQPIRKENMPVPTNSVKDISLPYKIAKNQYFESNNLYGVDFNEVLVNPNNYLYSHSLVINNGIVTILRGVLIKEFIKITPELAGAYKGYENHFAGIQTRFIGFIDLIEENDNGFKGIIRFTNGVPYYYIEDGTAQIKKINDDIIITMLYKPDPRDRNVHIPEGFQTPAKLVLEF